MKAQLAEYLGVREEQIYRVTPEGNERVGVLVDYGIGGIKKYHLSLSALPAKKEAPPAKAAPVKAAPKAKRTTRRTKK